MVENTIKVLMDTFIKHLAVMKQLKRVLPENQYTGQFGVILMDLLKKVVLFIIRMKTKATMTLQILLLWIKESITSFILLSGIEKTLIMQEKTLKSHKKNVKNGTGQKQGKSGIEKIITRIKNVFIRKSQIIVNNAGSNMNLKTTEEINTAQKIAKHKREEIAELITNKGLVASVVMFFLQISTHQKNTVVMNVSESELKEAVYCLSTNNGYFSLASGEIVSNCDSAGYFVAYKYPVMPYMPPIKPAKNIPTAQHWNK
jgi:hypothetical protein